MIKLSLPAQFRDLFKPARYKAFYGGRGSAKSHSFATALLMQAGKEPLRVLCGRWSSIGQFFAPAIIDGCGRPADAFTSANGYTKTFGRGVLNARKLPESGHRPRFGIPSDISRLSFKLSRYWKDAGDLKRALTGLS